MKLFGVILLSGYFLARERELFMPEKKESAGLLRDWAAYVACAGAAVFFGMVPIQDGRFQPAVILLAAIMTALLFRARAVCVWAGAATAYCVLRFVPDFNRVAVVLIAAECAVFFIALFYQLARARMRRVFTPTLTLGHLGALSLFFALAVLLGAVWQKAIQIYSV